MLNLELSKSLYSSRGVFTGWLIAVLVCFSLDSKAAPNVASVAPTNNPALDSKRHFALGMIETGNNDREVGRAGEISRYQIHPLVWKTYSTSRDYQNPEVSLQVARQHWTYLANYFKQQTQHEPSDFDMYVLWNTTYGYYARRGFSRQRLNPIVIDRAQRFVNLVNRQNNSQFVARN
ncbi:MAG: hypothetical protein JWQ71_3605 [Pedosphaera sp.]|nr:hypothetical protein [Pedosphaera sp.]